MRLSFEDWDLGGGTASVYTHPSAMRHGPIHLLHIVALALGIGFFAVLVPGTVLAASHAQTSPVPLKAPKPYVVAIDPGHGGYDPGAISPYNGLEEKNVTLSVALDLRQLLEAEGVKVVMSRTKDVFVSIPQAEAVAARNHANVFVSLWVNDWNTASLEGVTVFTPHNFDVPFANAIDAGLGRSIAPYGMGNRGVQPLPQLWVHAPMPTVTIESGFMSNKLDSTLLAEPAFRQALAQGITNGILAFAPQITKIRAQEMAYQAAQARARSARQLAAIRGKERAGVLEWGVVALVSAGLLFLAIYEDTLGRGLRWSLARARARAPALLKRGGLAFLRFLTPSPREPRARRPRPSTRRPTRPPLLERRTSSARQSPTWRRPGVGTRPQRVAEMVHPDEGHRHRRNRGSVYDDLSL
ncbi:MAG: N-acetylmuramoyl-L-alanine amidase family protein [Candidatus Dormibacteria bacterium]